MRCPVSKQPLIYFPRGEADRDVSDGFLLSVAARLRYRIDEGVPVLLAEEATEVLATEVDRLVARAKALGLA
ncbi:MAG: Trm112 family protein [Proteobacteria bacterium]|nr:Trm112 family protein [Pseudomonadota bacterium]